MANNWYVVANQRAAKIYKEVTGQERGLPALKMDLVDEIKNPLGQVRKKELLRKEAGQGQKSVGAAGRIRYSQRKRQDPLENMRDQFAKQIARAIEKKFSKGTTANLTFVAEPHFLGKMRKELDPKIRKIVKKWIGKDLSPLSRKEITDYLLPALRP